MILLIIHLVICLIIGILIILKKLNIDSYLFFVLLLIPFFGFSIVMIDLYFNNRKSRKYKKIGLEELKIDSSIYRRIEYDDSDTNIVPLEEAIEINDSTTRRRLMMEVLKKNPKENIDVLIKAGLSDDTELTHYATTTMMEIQGDYEARIKSCEDILKVNPQDYDCLRSYRKILSDYIGSNLLSGNVLTIYRNKLFKCLEELIWNYPSVRHYKLQYIETCLDINKIEEAGKRITEFRNNWPENEDGLKMALNYFRKINRGDLVNQLLKEIADNNYYLSPEGRQWFAFWENSDTFGRE